MGRTVTEDPDLPPYDRVITQNTGEHSFNIRIPARQRDAQKPFAVAGGLGYLFLHMGFEIFRELWDQQKTGMLFGHFGDMFTNHDLLWTAQAHYFALSLLMPKHRFISGIFKRRRRTVSHKEPAER